MSGSKATLPRWSRLSEATRFASEIHADQTRKGSDTPYISHLFQVAGLILEHGGDEDLAIAGLLHDAIEDVGAEQEAIIAERFGSRIARIVRACSDTDVRPKPPWQARKEAYRRHLETADVDVLLVSCADKVHNARAILTDLRTHGPAVFERFNASAADTIAYYRSLAEIFQRRLPGPLARDLMLSVAAIVETAGAAPGAAHG